MASSSPHLFLPLGATVVCLSLEGCGGSSAVSCGPGTTLEGGECVVAADGGPRREAGARDASRADTAAKHADGSSVDAVGKRADASADVAREARDADATRKDADASMTDGASDSSRKDADGGTRVDGSVTDAATCHGCVLGSWALPSPFVQPDLTAGPDGNVWFAEYGAPSVGRITPGGTISTFSLTPTAGDAAAEYGLGGIASGPRGHLWTLTGSALVEIAIDGTIVNTIALTVTGSPVVAGPDGNLWIPNEAAIERVTPSGSITTFPCGDINHWVDSPAVGPDGNIWFVESPDFVASSMDLVLGMVTTGASPKLTEFTTSVQDTAPFAEPLGIGAGPDGDLWFRASDEIAWSTTAGAVTTGPLPYGGEPELFAAAASDLWFTDQHNAVGRIDATGAIVEYPLIVTPLGIAIGADANVWLSGGGYILKVGP
jgi:streptogramin lyase